ncbi:ralBP1-associated Eps domain-containing protein 1 isoform X2 [Cephus cinctus]|uniref:RalBP1-associated Eps domain-containing protein 1 isoform X2 n=1 Tax=Cephus cinctus TaxID=211228 RepID=A0AAJ7FUN6_CEPCN|nr:ralBP1-associated Eps domain-containing protein 1 isoform X2 [Cephus cinctus]
MDWDSITVANLQLTETEHRYYGDIFIYCCDNCESESVPVVKAAELLRSANLPRDVTMKILDICVSAKGQTHLSRKQFYAALKLVAAHQSGLEIFRDAVTTSLDVIALPRFNWPSSGDEEGGRSSDSTRGSKGRSGGRVPESTTESESEAESPREAGGSTDSPTPTNSVTQERNDGTMGGETILDSVTSEWQGLLVSEEQRQLLGTEEESSERHSSDEADGDGDGSGFPPEEVWTISEEQLDYYTTQFNLLQSGPEGLLAGTVARTFFEKSRLPVAELRRIWQLADVTRDGALSLAEFYVAMHLVVLRRNHVPLPDVLPPSLAVLLAMQKTTTPPSVQPAPPVTQSSPPSTVNTRDKSKEWTKFVDSPTGTSGTLTSPGPKPVNFDFQKAAVERDPKILHPVPLRLTPEAAILASGANGNNSNGSTLGDEESQYPSINMVQRPLAKKPLPPPEESIIVTPKKEPPPPPPPRPYRTHARSSSLDLNKLERDGNDDDAGKDDPEDPRRLNLQELRERNAELRLVCEELTRELASALQERINLRAKLLLLT